MEKCAQHKEKCVLMAHEKVLADIHIASIENVQDGRLYLVTDKATLQNNHAHKREAEENEFH